MTRQELDLQLASELRDWPALRVFRECLETHLSDLRLRLENKSVDWEETTHIRGRIRQLRQLLSLADGHTSDE